MSVPRTQIRYATEEERKQARAETSRRYRERQKLLRTQKDPSELRVLHLEAELALMRSLEQSHSDTIQDLTAQLEGFKHHLAKLQESTVTYEVLDEFKARIVREFERVGTEIAQVRSKSLPISIFRKP
jgi:DNA repair ATPase RecN